MSSHGAAANATSAGRNERLRARRHAPKAAEAVPPPHLAVLDGANTAGDGITGDGDAAITFRISTTEELRRPRCQKVTLKSFL